MMINQEIVYVHVFDIFQARVQFMTKQVFVYVGELVVIGKLKRMCLILNAFICFWFTLTYTPPTNPQPRFHPSRPTRWGFVI